MSPQNGTEQDGSSGVRLGDATERAIFAQPREIERLASRELDDLVLRLGDCPRVWLVGTGSSEHAADLGAAMLAEAGVDARSVSARDFVRSESLPRAEDGVVIVTHTAESAFAISARAKAAEAGATLVAITRQGSGWPEAVETVPKESSETYTVSYTASLVVLAKVAAALGAKTLGEGILRTAHSVQEVLERSGTETIAPPERAMVLAGVGPTAVTAREGALKVREASRLLAEGYAAEYLLHGSAVPLGREDRLLLLQPSKDPDGLLDAIGRVAEAEGVAVTAVEEATALHPLLAQIPLTVWLQLLALGLARERGRDADVAITGAWAEEGIWAIGGPGPP